MRAVDKAEEWVGATVGGESRCMRRAADKVEYYVAKLCREGTPVSEMPPSRPAAILTVNKNIHNLLKTTII